MADLTIVSADVQRGARPRTVTVTAMASIVAGNSVVRFGAATGYLADAGGTASPGDVGVALNDAATGQPVTLQIDGDIEFGTGTATEGEVYVVSAANPGGIAPVGDLLTGDWVVLIGVGTANGMKLVIFDSDTEKE
jgi:hypothetical protein